MPASTSAALRSYLAIAVLVRCADEGVRVVLVLLSVERTGNAALGGALLAAWLAPHVLAAPLAGGVTDRAFAAGRPRLPYLLAFCLLGAVLAAVTAGIGRLPLGFSLVALALGGCAAPLLTGGLTSLLPRVLPTGAVGRGFGLDAASYGTAGVAGPAVAALLADAAGATVAGSVLAAFVVLAATLLLTLPIRAAPVGDVAGDVAADPASHPGPGLLDGALVLFRDRALRAGTVASSLSHAGIGSLPVALVVPFSQATAHRPTHLGFLLAAMSVGSFLGSLLHARFASWRAHPLAGVLIGEAGTGALMLAVAVTPSELARGVLLALAGLPAGFGFGALLLLRHDRTDPAVRAQAFSTGAGLKITLAAGGAALTGVLAGAGVLGAPLLAGVAGLNLLGALSGLVLAPSRAQPPGGGVSRASRVAIRSGRLGEPAP